MKEKGVEVEGRSNHPLLSGLPPAPARKGKVVTAEEAVRVIRNGDTIATGGCVGIGFAEELAIELEKYFLSHQKPRDLTLIYAAGQGDGVDRGLNHFGHKGLVKRVIGGHWGLVPKLQKLAIENDIIAYNLPQGVISPMYRDIAAQKPRTTTTVGLGTFVDPRHGGGKINDKTTEDIAEVISFDGQDYLAYKTLPIHIAILHGTTADTDGNIIMEKEALTLESLSIATAAKNSGGFVIVQVERIAERGTLNARQVKIPGIMVDCVVVSRPENHWQTFAEVYNPSFSSEVKIPMQSIQPMELGSRKVIVRRAAFELKANSVVNFEGYAVKTIQQVEDIKNAVKKIVAPLNQKVYTIVNYDNFTILPDIVDEYTDMVKFLVDNYYTGVTRYTNSTFMRMKLGDALQKRDVAPHIYESGEEARRALEND